MGAVEGVRGVAKKETEWFLRGWSVGVWDVRGGKSWLGAPGGLKRSTGMTREGGGVFAACRDCVGTETVVGWSRPGWMLRLLGRQRDAGCWDGFV